MLTQNSYRPIRDYAVIGDGHTAALVSSAGSIDWLCLPRFDSPAVFCRLLDAQKGGSFRIGPAAQCTVTRSYVGPTNVVATTFQCNAGTARLTDFIEVGRSEGSCRVLRLVEGLAGEPEFEIQFYPTFDFTRAAPEIEMHADGVIARSGREALALSSRANLRHDGNGRLTGMFRVRAGEQLWFALTYTPDERGAPVTVLPLGAEAALQRALEYWRNWAARCTYEGPYRDLVHRSALTLRLLIHEPTGALVAAPTTSLPETIGGEKNWDYRFMWLRDAGLILDALMLAGYHDETERYFRWLEDLCLDCTGGLRIMYTVDGSPRIPEAILDLEGYQRSAPVRVGNAAAVQRQLDVFGHVIDAMYFCSERMGLPLRVELWQMLRSFADQIAAIWHEPDQGPWEVRGEPRHFLYSKLFCWVGLDRALRIAKRRGESGEHVERWRAAREEVREAIVTRGYNEELGAFTYAFDEPLLDASVLAIPLVDFLPATDPRVRSTTEKIREQLSENGLVYRNRTDDLRGEGTFTLCSFWLVENLALQGRLDEARELFERIAVHASDLGLFSEEIDAKSGELLGNYPQGFTHLGLIRAASRIAAAQQAAESRP